MSFIWFWTFWHWSIDSFRCGSLLRGPVHGIGSHWDEWLRHDASDEDRASIERLGQDRFSQRRFIAWLVRHWAREAEWRGEHPSARFVLAQLSHVPPFDGWAAFEPYRSSYGAAGISAVVLAEGSDGEAADVRRIETIALPADEDDSAPNILAEDFQAENIDLDTARRAAMSLASGSGLLAFLGLWLLIGRRPYPAWFAAAVNVAWVAVAALLVALVAAPAAGDHLLLACTVLLSLWVALVLTASTVVLWSSARAWRAGKQMSARLERSQVRLRMGGGLTVRGGSAGLAFCLNSLLSIYRAHPREELDSWLWNRFFARLLAGAKGWVATGVVTATGRITPVVLEPKLRASLDHADIINVLTPAQRESGSRVIDRIGRMLQVIRLTRPPRDRAVAGMAVGFAAEHSGIRTYPCHHVAQAVIVIGGYRSNWQIATNVVALGVSVVMLVALPSLRGIVSPPAAPFVVAPSSPSPYLLWVSLDTSHPDDFTVLLESGFWSNRRADVKRYSGANASVRAELQLQRLRAELAHGEEDGIVWVERRRHLLGREFPSGERVGRYTLSYINRISNDSASFHR